MPVLRVAVKHKIATYISRAGEIVCGNSDYSIQFDFDEEWEAFDKKIARFIWNGKYFDQEFEGDCCPAPILSDTDSLQIGLYTYGDLHTTTPAVVPCCISILDLVETPHTENDKHYVSEAQQAAVEAKEAAEEAKNSLGGLETRMTEAEVQIVKLQTERSYGLVEEASAAVPQRDGRYFLLEPETYYAFGQVDSLAIYCQEPSDGRVHEFAFEFVPTENFTELEFYEGTAPQWAIAPQLKVGKPCQVSIMRGIGVSVGVI